MKSAIVVLLLACHVYVEGAIRQSNVEGAKHSTETTTAKGAGLLIAKNIDDLMRFGLYKSSAYPFREKRSYEKGFEGRSLKTGGAGSKRDYGQGPVYVNKALNWLDLRGGTWNFLSGEDDYDYWEDFTTPAPPKDDRPNISPFYRNKNGIITEEGARYLGGTRNYISGEDDYDYWEDFTTPTPPKDDRPNISPFYRNKNGIITKEGARYLGGTRNYISGEDDYDYWEDFTTPTPPKDDRPNISPFYRNKNGIISKEGARYLGGTRNYISGEDDYDYWEDFTTPTPPKDDRPNISPFYRNKNGIITEEGARYLGGTRNYISGEDDYDYWEDFTTPTPPKDDRPNISPFYRNKNGIITEEGARYLGGTRNYISGEDDYDYWEDFTTPTPPKDDRPNISPFYRNKNGIITEEGARYLGGRRKVNDHHRILKSRSYNKRSLPHIDRSHHSERLNSRKISEKDKKALLHPCTSEHYAFARRRQRQGCKGAVAFVQKVCGDFSDCLLKRTSSATKCESKICDKFYTVKSEEHCYDELFQCY